MPKQTFYNLPEDKKMVLIHAIKKEFSNVSFVEASISNIVHTADIPRGSFYQYFEDKEDAYLYILLELVVNINHQFILFLKEHDGDLFDALLPFFEYVMKELEEFDILKNAFLNMTSKIEDTFSKMFREKQSNNNYKELSRFINTGKLNSSNDRDFVHVMKIVEAVTFRNFVEKFARKLSVRDALENYTLEINLLKSGLARNE